MVALESVLSLPVAGGALAGVLALPPANVLAASSGVIIIVGGPQYRAGSHRQFVLLARSLAVTGHPVLRFDLPGMGDSPGAAQDFMSAGPGIAAALDAMQAVRPEVKHWVLWGLCDGASAALLYLHETRDTRVAGLCLLNPWVRSTASLAKTHLKHHYTQRLRQKEFWLKLLRGGIAGKALREFAANLGAAWRSTGRPRDGGKLVFQEAMASAWLRFPGKILLVLSGNDYTAREFIEYAESSSCWRGAFQQTGVTRLTVADADHTFSDRRHAMEVEAHTLRFLACWPSS